MINQRAWALVPSCSYWLFCAYLVIAGSEEEYSRDVAIGVLGQIVSFATTIGLARVLNRRVWHAVISLGCFACILWFMLRNFDALTVSAFGAASGAASALPFLTDEIVAIGRGSMILIVATLIAFSIVAWTTPPAEALYACGILAGATALGSLVAHVVRRSRG